MLIAERALTNLPPSSSPSPASPKEIARKASGRASWHRKASKPITVWMFLLLVIIFIHRWVPESLWLMVHTVALGLITNSILIWSQHFTEALLKVKIPDEARGIQVRRIYGLNISIIALMLGVVLALYPMILVGAIGVGVMVAWHGLNLLLQLKRALPARFDVTVRFYIVACGLLPIGATFGALLALDSLETSLHYRLLLAHETVNVLGFVGITVVGTLLTFWPTLLRTKMLPPAVKLSRIGLWGMVPGISTTTLAALLDLRQLAGAGLLIYASALLIIGYLMVKTCHTKKPSDYPTLSVAAGFSWLVVGVLWTAVLVFTTDFSELRLRTVTPVFVAGFLLQILLGAMSYLLPMRMGGGPAAVRASSKEFNRFSFGRVTIINICLIFFVLPVELTGSVVRAAVSVLGALTLASFLPLMIRGVKKSVAARKEMMAARRGEKPSLEASSAKVSEAVQSPHQEQSALPHARRELLIGSGAALAAVAAGIAIAPSSSGLLHWGRGQTPASNGEITRLRVEATSDMRFVPDRVEVPAGNTLLLEVHNSDSTNVHDLFLNVHGGVESGRISPGETAILTAGTITENVEGWCTILGHRAMGMTFSVVASGTSSTSTEANEHDGMNHGAREQAAVMKSAEIDLSAPIGSDFEVSSAVLSPIDGDKNKDGARVHRVTFDVSESEQEIAPGISINAWTFAGRYMGPVLHGALGDIFEITLKNGGNMGHSVDFHAGMISPNKNMRTIAPGEELIYRFEATGSGIWLYHCSTMPMSTHIAAGMFGAVIIDPVSLDTVDRELVLVQNETYLADTGRTTTSGNKIVDVAPDAVSDGAPTLTMWNGHATQYVAKPVRARVNEKVRIWVLAAGPSLGCSFHVVGSQFHTVYKEGAYLLRNSQDAFGVKGGHAQSLDLAPAQGGFVEMEFLEPGTYTFVNHDFAQMERGARGLIEVS